MHRPAAVLTAVLTALPALALPGGLRAEEGWDIYVYTGVQTATESDVSGRTETGAGFDFNAGWEGRSLDLPPYWGVRTMRDTGGPWSFGLELSHGRLEADDATLAGSGFESLGFSDGLNILTANAQRTFFESGRWTGRGGLGLGVAVPRVDVTTPSGGATSEYQLTGPAARWYLGADYAITDRWSAFAEYSGTYSINSVDLGGGGSLETDILTNALNVGIGFSF